MSADTSSADDDEQDGLETTAERLRTHHSSALVVVHDEKTEHIGYWDESARMVEGRALEYVQEQGFRVISSGIRECDTGHEKAWIEVRRRDPSEVYGE